MNCPLRILHQKPAVWSRTSYYVWNEQWSHDPPNGELFLGCMFFVMKFIYSFIDEMVPHETNLVLNNRDKIKSMMVDYLRGKERNEPLQLPRWLIYLFESIRSMFVPIFLYQYPQI